MEICNAKKCVGCYACYNACPKNCITMEVDGEGFCRPVINEQLCVKCGKCKRVCPVLTPPVSVKMPTESVYASYNLDQSVKLNSSSGGMFFALGKKIIDQGGVVFGAKMSEDNYSVVYDYVTKEEELIKFSGSKYVQAQVGNCYKLSKQFLDEGKKVLFSGTPCQIAGLKGYLNKEYENLYTVDLICHGVPSPKVWEEYLREKEKEYEAKAVSVKFRHKEEGAESTFFQIVFDNGKIYQLPFYLDVFGKGFGATLYHRNSCSDCYFKGENFYSDLTIGDYWGIERVHPEVNRENGISCVIARTNKGEELFNSVKDDLFVLKSNIEYINKYNPRINSSSFPSEYRKAFFKKPIGEGITERIQNYCKPSTKRGAFKQDVREVKREKGGFYAFLYTIKHIKEWF